MSTTAAVLEAPAFRVTMPGKSGETYRVAAESETEARRKLRDRLEITRLPPGVKVEPWEGAGPESEPASDAEVPEVLTVPDFSDVASDRATAASAGARKPAKKAGKVAWKTLPDAELAAHLLAHITLPDTSWADRREAGQEREKGESREHFIRRVLLGETDAA